MTSVGRIGWRFGIVIAAAWLVLLFLVLPLSVVFPVSLTSKRYLSLPEGEYSFRHYVSLFTSDEWLTSIWHSTVIASTSTVIAVTLGTLFAVGCWRVASRGTEIAWALMLTPLIVPPIVHALGFYRMWVELGLIDTFFGVILAHVLISLPFVVITVSTSLAHFDLRLELAARNLGASMRQTMTMVIVPCIKPGILTGAVFAFTLSWDEIVVVMFITSRNVYTLPRRMWDGVREHVDPTIAAMASVLIFLTFTLLFLDFVRRARRLENSSD